MNTVTPEQLAAAHQADLEAWRRFHAHSEAIKDAEYHQLWASWRAANGRSHELQQLYDAQQLCRQEPATRDGV